MEEKNMVKEIRRLTRKKLPAQLPKKWRAQFDFGMRAYAFQTYQSATGNARAVIKNPDLASRKAERLLANHKLTARLGKVFDAMELVKPNSFVNIDHTDMHEILALVGAVQTRMGRAIPCMVEATYAHTIPAQGSKTSSPRLKRLRSAMEAARAYQSFTGHTIDSLQDFHDRLGFWPRLVFDRGFGNESLVRHLVAEGAVFYIRLKAGRFVHLDKQRYTVQGLKEDDVEVKLFGQKLRVIRSEVNGDNKEPWYILTNDFKLDRDQIVDIYYHRFEIEETFRDMKHLWGLHRMRLNKPNSVKTVVWFVSFGIAMSYLLTKPKPTDKFRNTHKKKRISWVRNAHEARLRDLGQLLYSPKYDRKAQKGYSTKRPIPLDKCPKCGSEDIIGIEYIETNPMYYDGVSEWNCQNCGYRQGRWTGQELSEGYFESPFGG